MTNKMIFLNLPVRDLARSMSFFRALGYTFNEKFTDDSAACLVISETIYAMLLTHEKFQGFMPQGNQIVDAFQSTQALIALSCTDRDEVNALVAKAVAAGGRIYNEPQDHGFMYGHGFQDPDGHVWEVFWMDPAMAQG
ncbi:hypothetical protein SAMN02745166_04780 [Prosthecobacter debontii]|uniref:VOC domain-containing protein n=1 Tax=Prosthecobacter debontii TaxID=48467 RepID=A0A1T4Z146_9BACT|nr:VOC family protein [Prosthecobacter debontii]SKB07752.1 hypothetical protein SAMN02745166_04780 [Prosthecobacter debontii]